jgi:hypothetical protein
MEEVGILYGHLGYFTAIWAILRPFGLFYGHLVHIHILWPFGIFYIWLFVTFFTVLVCCAKTNLATLAPTGAERTDSFQRGHFFGPNQSCQMVSFQTKNPNLGKFWRVLH